MSRSGDGPATAGVAAPTVKDADLRAFVTALLERMGYSNEDAALIADGLVEADVRGITSHGTLHVPNIAKRTKLGLVNTRPNIRTLKDAASSARLDADRAPGFVAAMRAMDLAIAKAKSTGVGAVAVTNSTHYGMGARYAERAARAGMIGLALANATATMPSPGGTLALLGTNPISFAVPGEGGETALCLDMGLAQVTLNAVRDAAKRGRALPEGVAAAKDGTPTTDAAKALDDGFLLPFGGHKGFGLAVVVEVLAGVLTGSAIGREVGSLFVDYDRPQNTGHFMLALDPTHFLTATEFRAKREFLVRWIKDSPRAANAGPALLPGEREYDVRRERLLTGIPLAKDTAADLGKLARELGVSVPRSVTNAAA
jgi:LDH2 family malate/lactate/ureidoglycolate dehydrogenase